jgi:polysaccharide biosynthesis/export protein
MKKLLIITILIYPLTILSQNLDSAYLESLPIEIRQDVLEEMGNTTNEEKPIYKRPTSMVEQQKDLEARLMQARAMLDEITLDLEINDVDEIKKPKKRFGKSIFNMMQSSFMPINEPNFDGSYILDFGDVLEVQLITQKKDFTKKIPVKRDGSINIPDIGKIFVSGLSLESASELVKSKIDSAFIGSKVFISLVNVRDIQILISGNSMNPGVYTMNGNSNLLHAISMSGGIDDLGSYRDIQVIREGEVIGSIDLYDIFVFGKPNFGPKLRSGDSIFINQSEILVTVVSGVNRPHVYELKNGENFKDAIKFANNLKTTANLDHITVQRLKAGKIITIDISVDDLANFFVNHRDIINIREYQYGTVTIEGAVNDPGEYNISDGTTLSDVIKNAGGYKESAYPFGGFLNNKKTEKLNKDAKDRLYSIFIKNLANNLSTLSSGSDSTSLPMLISELKKATISGRVMAEFDLDMIDANQSLDTVLEDQDSILIPYVTQQVYVFGEISTQGSVRYSPGKNLRHYINSAGGILETGEKKSVFVVHPNGKTERLEYTSRLLRREKEILIYPGSIIYVPQSSNLLNGVQSAAVWAPIISSITLSLTSLSVLNSN